MLALAGQAQASLGKRLSNALRTSGVPWSQTGALVTSLADGKIVYRRGAGNSLRPASNEKLTVAVATLDRLGPTSRIRTTVVGRGTREKSVWRGALFLEGHGDPTLAAGDLRGLARKVRASGIRRVTGAVRGDESYFDKRRTAPGWKASFYKLECPPLSALVVDRGKVGAHTATSPARMAARAFRAALQAAGVSVGGKARLGVAPADGAVLATSVSPTLRWMLRRMNRQSDNFSAEMLLKRLGAVVRGQGTTADGVHVVRRVLKGREIPLSGVRLVDGSGLSLDDRLTARAIGAILRSAYADGRIRKALYGSLPRAGLDGTLKDRMKSPPARGLVRAKTGTTSNASALSGYVGKTYVFSVLQNGYPVPWISARTSQDRFAQILAARVA